MADEPDNLVLVMLREIRSTQTQDSQRLTELEKQLKSLNTKVTYLMGVSTGADFKAQTALDAGEALTAKLDDAIARLQGLEGAR